MTETQSRVTACLNSALQSFNQNEQYLISRDLSERCICAKFASYLERAIAESEFREYVRFLYKGIIIKHNKTEPTYTKTSLFLCEKRRFFMARTEKGVVTTI